MTDWQRLLAVPRAPFIPSTVWIDDADTGGFIAISRDKDEPRWRALVEADRPIVTQVDDGATKPDGIGRQPSSSSSQPSLVADMLAALDVRAGHRVLEIGTGTGWNAALLSERTGAHGQVVSIEVDPDVAASARRALADAGHPALVVVGDGTGGHPAGAPYDRIICTASVREIPYAWIEQTTPGGVIVVPWGSDYGDDALTRLTIGPGGSASGRCGNDLAFMRLRNQRREYLEPGPDELRSAATMRTTRSGRELFEMVTFAGAAFSIGLRVPSCYLTVEDINNDRRLIELHDMRSRSWARVTLVRGQDPWSVQQLGARLLWHEVDAAYSWWHDAGEPTPDRYGLTVAADGSHQVWLDAADNVRWDPHIPQHAAVT